MHISARDSYLTTEVMTATPQKLQLMLLDGAIRFIRQGQDLWEQGDDLQADESLTRAEQIITELLGGLNPEADRELVRRVASVYLFLFRTLTTAHLHRDPAKLAEVMQVLEIERETWRQVCDRLGSNLDPAESLGMSSFVA